MKEHEKPSNPDLHKGQVNLLQDRVTLRDHFAGLAMQSVIISNSYDNFTGNNGIPVPVFFAEQSYLIADAMLKQREL